MIHESFPWKQDLIKNKKRLLKYNTVEYFTKDSEKTYTMIEKAIFYSAFIMRKLLDCGGKLSNEADNYSVKAFSIHPINHISILNRCLTDDNYDLEHEEAITISGKNVCNSLIHSFVFSVRFNDKNIIDSFFITSDRDKNKRLYRIPLDEWLKYIDFIATDEIERLELRYCEKKKDFTYTQKERKKHM